MLFTAIVLTVVVAQLENTVCNATQSAVTLITKSDQIGDTQYQIGAIL